MRRLIAAMASVFLLTAAAPQNVVSIQPGSFDAATRSKILGAIKADLASYGGASPVPGAFVGIWMPGKAPFVQSVGVANISTKQPFAPADHFRIGSNTKTFVVTVLLQLADEGTLHLDDPISRFNIGVHVPNGEHITLRQLCEMRSGIPDAYNTKQMEPVTLNAQTKIPIKQLVTWAVDAKPLFPPGTKYNYSNTNYLMLGLVIESVTKDSLEHQLQTRLIDKYGLSQTTFPSGPELPAPYAHGYQPKGTAWQDVSLDTPGAITWAAGAMVSTVPDMERWVKLYVSGATNSQAMQRARLTCLTPSGTVASPDQAGFGLGVGCSHGWYGYTGGIPGYNTSAFYFPKGDATIVAFVTSQIESPKPGVANSIVRDITKILFPNNVMSP